jgi:4-amino-4-deoxy-L-arabinose transferase-like glycosyltransferase
MGSGRGAIRPSGRTFFTILRPLSSYRLLTLTPKRLVFVLIVGVTTLVGVFDHDLWAPDEPRAAELGREFLDGGSWMFPRLAGEPFLEKPPLVYWTIAASLKLFGAQDWAARLPAVLFGWGTLLFTFLLARKIYGSAAAELAVLMLATSVGFLVVSHHVESDAGLVCFVSAAAYFLWRGIHESSWAYGAAAAAAVGAFFCKGPIGLIFPGLLLLTWVAWNGSPRELLRARPWLWLPLMSLAIGAWLYAISRIPGLMGTFLVENGVKRFLGSRGAEDRGHLKPLWYYFVQLPLWFLPWTPALFLLRRSTLTAGGRFLISWAAAGFVFLSIAGSKRAVYLVPILPPLTILTAAPLMTLPWARFLKPAVAAFTLTAGITWLCVVGRLNERLSCKPFCLDLAVRLKPESRLYVYDVDETALAVIPFYTGRVPLKGDAPTSIPDEDGVVVLTQDVRGKAWHTEMLIGRFPHVWLSMPEGRDHRMRVFSKQPQP